MWMWMWVCSNVLHAIRCDTMRSIQWASWYGGRYSVCYVCHYKRYKCVQLILMVWYDFLCIFCEHLSIRAFSTLSLVANKCFISRFTLSWRVEINLKTFVSKYCLIYVQNKSKSHHNIPFFSVWLTSSTFWSMIENRSHSIWTYRREIHELIVVISHSRLLIDWSGTVPTTKLVRLI